MRNSSGIVMQVDKKYAFIMTEEGEFLKVKMNGTVPAVGQIYEFSSNKKYIPFYKYAAVAASLAFILIFGSVTYAYYTPAASVDISINPSIRLNINRWEKIIKSIPLNDDGQKILASIDIKNKLINDGLNLIIDEAKKDDFINKDYIESGKTITVSIDSKNSKKNIDLSEFENYTKQNNIKIQIIENKKEDKEKIKSNGSNNNNIKPNTPIKNIDTKEKHSSQGNDKKDDSNSSENKTKKNIPASGNGNSNQNKENKNNKFNNNASSKQKENNASKSQNNKAHRENNNKDNSKKEQS